MELVILGSILGFGYYLNKDGLEKNRFEGNNVQDFLKNHEQKINGTNIYNSTDSINIRNQEQEMANKLYREAQNTTKTNVLIPGPPSSFIDSNNQTTEISKLPVEFTSEYTEINRNVPPEEPVNDISFNNSSDELSGGWNATTGDKKISKLTGGVVENFHNNILRKSGAQRKNAIIARRRFFNFKNHRYTNE